MFNPSWPVSTLSHINPLRLCVKATEFASHQNSWYSAGSNQEINSILEATMCDAATPYLDLSFTPLVWYESKLLRGRFAKYTNLSSIYHESTINPSCFELKLRFLFHMFVVKSPFSHRFPGEKSSLVAEALYSPLLRPIATFLSAETNKPS